jgi:type II restriction enzyme
MTIIYQFDKNENKFLRQITTKETNYYMTNVLVEIDKFLDPQKPLSYQNAFDELHDIIKGCQNTVGQLIEERKNKGLIKDINQAQKSVVGNIFPYSLIYIFLKNKEIGNIKEDIYITNKASEVPRFKEEISVIKLGNGEQQKPDFDIIIYQKGRLESDYPKCIILSLKTSLRERAAQTYKWKLLLEIAGDNQSKVKEKYGIIYDVPEIPSICFATVNFYDEINNPQQKGMLKFFDRAFLAKKVQSDFISPLSELVDFVNQYFTVQD